MFASHQKLTVYPFCLHWAECEEDCIEENAQVLIVAPKRKLRHAVDRNRVKRQMRELYRTNKPALYDMIDGRKGKLLIAINYLHTSPMNYAKLQSQYAKLMEQFTKQLQA